LILQELYILNVALLLVLAYSAKEHDRRDGPLAMLFGYVLAADLGMTGLKAVWYRVYQQSHSGLARGRAVRLLLRGPLGGGLSLPPGPLAGPAGPQGYGPGRRALAGGRRACSAAAASRPGPLGHRRALGDAQRGLPGLFGDGGLAQVFRKKDVASAHLVLGFCIVISIIQFLLALRPWAWDMSLYHLANLVFYALSLTAYGLRLVRSSR